MATVSLGLVWKGQLDGLAAEFIDFLFSPQAQRIISEYGAVSVND
jgi:ABC-type sulfate transport system substrate-binding protein